MRSEIGFIPVSITLLAALLSLSACDRDLDAQGQDNDMAVSGDKNGSSGSGKLVGKLDISQRGSAMLDVKFNAPDGSTVQLSDFKGKPLLVNIWATWCAPCVLEMPMLDNLAQREGERLNVMTVSQDLSAKKAQAFFDRKNFKKLQNYTDPENGLSFGYETGLMPTTVLYDSEGKEIWRVVGAMDWDGAKAATLMEETLAGG